MSSYDRPPPLAPQVLLVEGCLLSGIHELGRHATSVASLPRASAIRRGELRIDPIAARSFSWARSGALPSGCIT